ncbi:IlvA, threonine dehydratase [Bombardia bombarda]|uniref:IlvA, threonine dehydratase n=1 Tax=Bombardia bombarda TaxID=252184 RepID=A0AA39XM70_9PEZI|nr:IlvA, threonine dehydratase [Bombardia bombarda]
MADPSTTSPLTRASVQVAHDLIRSHIHKTPVLTNKTLTQLASTPRTAADLEKEGSNPEWKGRTPARPVLRLWFKCENLQRIGAFKARGAFHAIERLKQEPGWAESGGREKGVITHSSGNHAQALALAARTNSIPAYIIMPTISAPPKIAATRDTYGATVVFSGSTSVEREAATARGTMGLELQDQVLEQSSSSSSAGLDAIITPCGGGGMLSGVALSCEGTGIRVFGAEPSFEGADDAKRGYYAGERVEAVSTLTIADGLRTPVGKIPWSIIYERRLVAGMYSVTEDEIKAALRLVYERMKLVVEPSAVVGLAVALFNEDFRAMVEREAGEKGWDLGIVFSGGNVSLDALGKLFA